MPFYALSLDQPTVMSCNQIEQISSSD